VATKQLLFSYHALDDLAVEATINVYMTCDDAKTLAQVDTDFATVGTALDAITGAQITKGKWSLLLGAQGSKTGPASGSRVEQTAVFDFNNAVTTRKQGIAVPGFLSTLLTAGRINLSATAVSTFTNLLSTGTALVSVTPANAAFQNSTVLADAFLSFRKRRKQLYRSSVEL
jgi:hypothetical protein